MLPEINPETWWPGIMTADSNLFNKLMHMRNFHEVYFIEDARFML